MLFPTMRVQIVHGPAAPGGAATDKALGDLPEWNLDDLYPGIESAPLRSDLERAFADAQALAERYRGQLAELAPPARRQRPVGRRGQGL